ncbi:SdiA-regulated domain-containing protein [Mucilaginibacter calamicampi]|uniref:SdiA-regulated domain-containing protein n=1 Tax=Mucilaginibacter calamicampi TaxID=1302352 RepID=A0ABW2YTS6_9SPHI
MMKIRILLWLVFAWFIAMSVLSCNGQQRYSSPQGYDLNNPVKYFMPDALNEISGIAFHNGKADSIYAEQDEDGHVYYMKLGDKKAAHSKFEAHGDYEDIAIMGNEVFVLRSDGQIFTFPFKQVRSGNIKNPFVLGRMLPKGEYESMYAEEKTKRLYVLCKTCKDNDNKNFVTGHFYTIVDGMPEDKIGLFSINVNDIKAKSGKNKMSFHPSALAKNLRTNEWYILSSVNKLLVVTDANWKVKAAYSLPSSLFLQPEGIAFDNQNNLYISNEGDKMTKATVLKFNFKK